jgi:DNA-binding SARP family transcriptional activator/tetratricopeptide (TPR) repeat protein
MPSSEFPDGSVCISLHGAAWLRVGARPPMRLERKQGALLAYLHYEGPSPRAKLAGLLWPDAAYDGARGNLRQCIARLRRMVTHIVTDADGLLALSPHVIVASPEEPGATLLGAFDYGDCDAFARWLEARIEGERSRGRAALTADIKRCILAGELDRAETLADKLLAFDHESEGSYRALMEVLYLRGDFAAAIAVWDRCRDMLRRLYGVTPATATRELGEAILGAARSGAAGRVGDAQAIPLSVLRPPRLIARAAQLDAMVAAWRAGDTLCICGEAGIGKSRLLAEFANILGTCIVAAARPGDVLRPYASLTRMVAAAVDRHGPMPAGDDARWTARLLPELAYLVPDAPVVPLQTDHERKLALEALQALLTVCVRRGCKAFILDDLQYADRATLEALPALLQPHGAAEGDASAGPASPRFALGTRLDEASAPGAALIESLAATRRFVRIELAPLADVEVNELLASIDLAGHDPRALALRLYRQVGGNPAFLLESLKLMLSLGPFAGDSSAIPIPPGIEAVMERRIALLTAPARHIAQLAAIAGSSYSVTMAAAALACPVLALAEPLRELELRQVLYGRKFVHDLVASAVARSVPASVGEFMQRFIAEYLEEHDGDPAVIAHHWRACSEWRRAGACHRRAADAAKAAARPREQCEHLDAAAECFQHAGADNELFDTLDRRLEINEVADRVAMRAPLLDRLDELARTEEQRLRALLKRLSYQSEHAKTGGVERLAEGQRRALAIDLPALAFEFSEPIAFELALRGELDAAIAMARSVLPWVEAQHDATLHGRVERTLSVAYGYCDRLAPAIAHGESAIAWFRSVGDDLGALPTMSNIGLFQFWRGELDAARAILEQARSVRDRLHGSGSMLVADLHLAAVLRDMGEFDVAHVHLESLVAQFRAILATSDEPPTDLVIAENHQAQLYLMLGQPESARAALRTDTGATDLRYRARRLVLQLRADRAQGGDPAPLLAQAQPIASLLTSAFNRAMLELELARWLDADGGVAEFARLHATQVASERPGMRLQAATGAAQAELARGRIGEARIWIDRALALAKRVRPFDLDPAEPFVVAHDVLQAGGDPAGARRQLRCALDLIDSVASRLPPEWHDAYLRQHPVHRAALERWQAARRKP